MEYLEEAARQRRCRLGIWIFYIFYDIAVVATCVWDEYFQELCIEMIFVSACLTVITFSKQFSNKYQSYMLMSGGVMNCLVSSIHDRNFYLTMVILMGCTVMLAVFKDENLVTWQAILSILLLAYHALILNTVNLSNYTEITSFIICCLVFVAVAVFLRAFLHRQAQIEESLRESARTATLAEHAKADFLANMSHEIRTPMNTIIGMCELALREEISEQAREYCFHIQNSGRSLLAIINDILDFSKIESGKMEFSEQPFSIVPTLNEVVNMTLTRMGDKKLELLVDVDPDIPREMVGDELKIRRVIINLMTNAVKFTNKGSITLHISRVWQENGMRLAVSVKDTGIGITAQDIERLFTSFQQVDTKKNRAVEGTGLGLAISKNLLVNMGGMIDVKSEYGKGSEFWFEVPLKIADPDPFLAVRDGGDVHAVCYLERTNLEKRGILSEYQDILGDIGKRLAIDFRLYTDFSMLELAIKQGDVTHCFVGKEEYLAGQSYFDGLPQQIERILIQDRQNAISVAENMRSVYYPFYALSVVSVLNRESMVQSGLDKKRSYIRFTAPDAKILLVDDNATNLQVASGLMRPYKMQIVTANGGLEAMELLKGKDIDLVFMDHMMPELDGVETTQRIRAMEDAYYQKLPIVALTANAVSGVRNMFIEAGFQDYMAKPMELSVLDRVLRNWLPADLIMQAEPEAERKVTQAPPKPQESLADIMDPELGLHYAGGYLEDYLDILSLFLSSAPEKEQKLREYTQGQDWKSYIIEIHALKSASLSIGAKKLSEEAKKLEMAGKSQDYRVIEEENDDLFAMLRQVTEAGNAYLEQCGQTQLMQDEEIRVQTLMEDAQEVSRQQLEEILEQLESAAADFDRSEMIAIAKQARGMVCEGELLAPCFEQVIALTKDFEYDAACEVARKMFPKLPEGV